MENNKLETLENYINGNITFLNLLLDIVNGSNYSSNIEYDTSVVKTSLVANMCALFQGIKEDLVDKDLDNDTYYIPLVFEKSLEASCKLLGDNKNYTIDGYSFNSATFLVATLRNKLSHGLFYLDLDNNNIVFNIDSSEVRIDINKLSCFVVDSFNNVLINPLTSKYEKKIVINSKIPYNRVVPMKYKGEYKNFISNTLFVECSIVSLDKTPLSKKTLKKFAETIDEYKLTFNEGVLSKYKAEVHSNYKFNYEFSSKIGKELDSITDIIYNNTLKTKNYKDQAFDICKLLNKYYNDDKFKHIMMVNNLSNLLVLDSIEKAHTFDKNKLLEKFSQNGIVVDYNNIAGSSLSLFNALFSYGLENVYNSLNLDYSIFNFDLFDIKKIKMGDGVISDISIRIKSSLKEKEELCEKLKKLEKSASILKEKGNMATYNIVLNNINNINERKPKKENDILELLEKRVDICNNNKLNELSIKNKSIIEHLRNCIAHGNYKLNYDYINKIPTLEFYDIYNNELTFHCNVKLDDFITTIKNSYFGINDFINSNKKGFRY